MKKTVNLIRQGYYREMPHGEPNDPSITAFTGKANPAEIEHICAYLDSGTALVVCSGVSFDVIKSENGIAGTPSVLTDGKFAWPGDLSYYVRRYALALDPSFTAYMREQNWQVDFSLKEIDIQNIFIEGTHLFA